MRKFTKQQVDFICYQIGEWYVQWKNQLVDYEAKTHRLGQAKEALQIRINQLEEEVQALRALFSCYEISFKMGDY